MRSQIIMVGSILRFSKMNVYGCDAPSVRQTSSVVRLLYDFVWYNNPNAMSLCTLCLDFLVPTLFHLVLANSPPIRHKYLLFYRLGAGEAGEHQSIGEMAPGISYEILV